MNRFVFGTYKLRGEKCEISLKMAANRLIVAGEKEINIDTAQLYQNEKLVKETCDSFADKIKANITTKIKQETDYESTIALAKRSIDIFGNECSILLHEPMHEVSWKALESLYKNKEVSMIGLSNHSLQDLKALLSYAEIKPQILQIEFHPFIEGLNELIEFCKQENIKIQGHSLLAQGKFLTNEQLQIIAKKYDISVAQVMLRWAYQHDIDLCLTTSNIYHLIEDLAIIKINSLNQCDMNVINELHKSINHRFYINRSTKSQPVFTMLNIKEIAETIRKEIEYMKIGYKISDLSLSLPKTWASKQKSEFARELAIILFAERPEELLNQVEKNSCWGKYEKAMKQLRIYYSNQIVRDKFVAPEKNMCCVLKAVREPLPMPVEIAESSQVKPFFTWLTEEQSTHIDVPQMFERGTMFPDGRMDMCKQVVGPKHIKQLCESVAKNTTIKHFLLGNNIACDGGDLTGAQSIADLMRSDNEITTWYLAGNCIDANCIKIICEGLRNNIHCRALWLKRNPLLADGAEELGKLLNTNHTIELLDLSNCGLLDEGLIRFCKSITSETIGLKHLYLDSNGLTINSMPIFCEFLRKYRDTIETLYMSINRLGDEGSIMICEALATSKSLKRLCLASNGITSACIKKIVDSTLSWNEMIMLGLGWYKSTRVMGEKNNMLDDEAIPELQRLLIGHPKLQFMSILNNNFSYSGISKLVSVLKPTMSMEASQIIAFAGPNRFIKRHTKEELREIKHPALVWHIDSVYRNTM